MPAVDAFTGEFRSVQSPEAEMRSCRRLLVAALTAVSVVLPGAALVGATSAQAATAPLLLDAARLTADDNG